MEMVNVINNSPRSHLKFEEHVRKEFSFLTGLGFLEIESSPTLVRYQNSDIEVTVYHGRQSYEIGVGVTTFDTQYSISEIVRATDPEEFNNFRYPMTTTEEGVVSGLERLSSLLKRYGSKALKGDQGFYLILDEQRKQWTEEYALDVLVEQLRPKANEAFRRKDYSSAVELYSRIKERLSPAELKKLGVAKERCND
ncbi:MAG: hypothetical protein O2967_21210 [Proteobacteria bacterium]|nr:hypothetical protein [Pseudomonadota bacterium]